MDDFQEMITMFRLAGSWSVPDSKQWVAVCAHQAITIQMEVKYIEQVIGQKSLLLIQWHVRFGLRGKSSSLSLSRIFTQMTVYSARKEEMRG